MREHGPWKIIHSNQIYRGPWLTLTKDDVLRPDGHAGTDIALWKTRNGYLAAGFGAIGMEDRRFYQQANRSDCQGSGGLADVVAMEMNERRSVEVVSKPIVAGLARVQVH